MRTLWCSILVVALAACQSGRKEVWETETFEVRSERTLWEVLRMALDRADFAVGSGADPAARTIESAWMVDPSPFKGRGFRRKAHLSFGPSAEGKPHHWDVRVRIELDTNESFKGLDLRYAEWKPGPDDEAAAKRVLQFARSMLGGGDFRVGPERRSPLERRTTPPTLEPPSTVSP